MYVRNYVHQFVETIFIPSKQKYFAHQRLLLIFHAGDKWRVFTLVNAKHKNQASELATLSVLTYFNILLKNLYMLH